MSYLHSSLSLAVTVRTVCWMSSFSSTSASYRFLSKYGGLSFLSAIPIRMNFDTEGKMTVSYFHLLKYLIFIKNCSLFINISKRGGEGCPSVSQNFWDQRAVKPVSCSLSAKVSVRVQRPHRPSNCLGMISIKCRLLRALSSSNYKLLQNSVRKGGCIFNKGFCPLKKHETHLRPVQVRNPTKDYFDRVKYTSGIMLTWV